MARILVADDESCMRELFAEACSRAGHEVHAMGDADTAVAAFLGLGPDLLILDLNMGGGGSREILDRLQALSPACACPAILTSGEALEDLEAEAARHRWIREILRKPFTLAQLYAALDTALGEGS